MKRLILILILTLSFQSWTKAEDISDFEIEGISIGDSLLDHFSEEVIQRRTLNYYKNKTILPIYIQEDGKFTEYDGVQFHINKKFKIIAIEGIIWFKNDFKGCQNKQKEIDREFKSIFLNTDRSDTGIKNHDADKSGKSIYRSIYYEFKSKDKISIGCYDWAIEKKHPDNLRVGIISNELQIWINTKAYK
tara:strand:- start:121 stop:690 length:570 start_codon:yes stop_codon:yes gene_type:complete